MRSRRFPTARRREDHEMYVYTRHSYYFFDPDTQFRWKEKNYATQYKKVQKSSWDEHYSPSFTKLSRSKMALYWH